MGPEGPQWRQAVLDELANHAKQKTWNAPSKPPPNAHVLPGRWVLAYKFGPMGEIIKYKAEWVVKAFKQIEGVDFMCTFSSTLKASSWRLLLALVAKHSLHIEYSDVVAVYLESLIHEVIWVEQPHGFTNGNKHQACLLNKALYGLKQAANKWYQTLHSERRNWALFV